MQMINEFIYRPEPEELPEWSDIPTGPELLLAEPVTDAPRLPPDGPSNKARILARVPGVLTAIALNKAAFMAN